MPRKVPPAAPERVRKNMDIDARKLAAARRVLGARTDTETVDQALDYVVFLDEVFGALDGLAALGGLADVHAERAPARRARHVAER